jgi:hypothetical protein
MTDIKRPSTVAETARLAFMQGPDGEPPTPLVVRLENYIETLKADSENVNYSDHIQLLEAQLANLKANPEEASELEHGLEGYLDVLYAPLEPVDEIIDCRP